MSSTNHSLREILIEGKARTQLEILQAFKEKGISCSQSKVSRLLNQIGAVKVVDNQGKTHYRLPHEAGLIHELTSLQEKTMIREWVLNILSSETMIIIHTTPGAASMVARIIDQHRLNLQVLGTIAGDDSIFIAPQSIHQITETMALISKLLNL